MHIAYISHIGTNQIKNQEKSGKVFVSIKETKLTWCFNYTQTNNKINNFFCSITVSGSIYCSKILLTIAIENRILTKFS